MRGDGGAHSRHSGKMDEQLRDDYHSTPPNPPTTLTPTPTTPHEVNKSKKVSDKYHLPPKPALHQHQKPHLHIKRKFKQEM